MRAVSTCASHCVALLIRARCLQALAQPQPCEVPSSSSGRAAAAEPASPAHSLAAHKPATVSATQQAAAELGPADATDEACEPHICLAGCLPNAHPGSGSESSSAHVPVPFKAVDEDEAECVVCWAADAEVLLQPCGHLCTCRSCAKPFLSQPGLPCPMCRVDIAAGVAI